MKICRSFRRTLFSVAQGCSDKTFWHLGIILLALVPSFSHALVIDDFDQGNLSLRLNHASAGDQDGPDNDAAPGILGGSRTGTLLMQQTQGSGNAAATAEVFGGLLDMSTQVAAKAKVTMVWDANGAGLGGIDLTEGGKATKLLYRAPVPIDNDLTITVTINGTSTATKTFPNGTAGDAIDFQFTDFSDPNAFQNVTSIKMELSGPFGWDAQIDFTGTDTKYDLGDAPDTYGTTDANSGPRHALMDKLYLGDLVDADHAADPGDGEGQPSTDALGDDNNQAGNVTDPSWIFGTGNPGDDDEDGVNPADLTFTPGQTKTITVQVHNTTGGDAHLYGWIDFDGNGTFDAGERADVVVPNGATSANLDFTAGTYTGTTYARFRLSTDGAAANPTGAAGDGEVEDYRVTVTGTASPPANAPIPSWALIFMALLLGSLGAVRLRPC